MFGLSTELKTKGKLSAVKEIRVLTFRALALCQSEGLTLEMSALESLLRPTIYL